MLERMGKYEIRQQIGRGAMGAVYEALDPVINRRVAIKTLRLEMFELRGRRPRRSAALAVKAKTEEDSKRAANCLEGSAEMPEPKRNGSRRTGPALGAMYRFILWFVPAVEKFPRSQKFVLGDRIMSTALGVLDRLGEATYTCDRADGGRCTGRW